MINMGMVYQLKYSSEQSLSQKHKKWRKSFLKVTEMLFPDKNFQTYIWLDGAMGVQWYDN